MSSPNPPNFATTTAQSRSSLTFGIEYEIVLSTFATGTEDPQKGDPRIGVFTTDLIPSYAELAQAELDAMDDPWFKELGPAAQAIANILNTDGIHAFPWFRRTRSIYTGAPLELMGWEIKPHEYSGAGPDGEVFLYLEVVSPKLRRTYTNNAPRDLADFDEAGRVLAVLTRHFRMFVDQSCGIHVHVGQDANSFPLQTVRKLMALLYAFEPGIEALHPKNRRNRAATYCLPLRKFENAGLASEGPDAIDVIMGQASIEDLVALLFMGADPLSGRSAYNLGNLVPANWKLVKEKRTIEFRQHEATLDPDAAVLWAKFCVHIVDFARITDEDTVREVCRREIAAQMSFGRVRTLEGFCKLISFPEGVKVWEGVTIHQDGNEEGSEV